MVRKVLQVLWVLATAGYLALSCYVYEVDGPRAHAAMAEFLFLVFTVVGFPLSFAGTMVLVLCYGLFESVTEISLPSLGAELGLVLSGLFMSSLGFYQWFVLFPRFMKRGRSREEPPKERALWRRVLFFLLATIVVVVILRQVGMEL